MKIRCLALIIILISSLSVYSMKIEFSLNKNYWNINHFKSLIDKAIQSSLEEEIEDKFQEDFPDEILKHLDYDYDYRSRGDGMGFNVRIYPAGEYGIFSIGFSYTSFDAKISIDGNLDQTFLSQSIFTGTAEGEINFLIRAYLIDLSWEFYQHSKVRPYFSIGAGISPLRGDLSYFAEGIFRSPTGDEYYSASDETDFRDIDDIKLSNIPILALSTGIKYYFIDDFNIYADIGFFNGLMYKFGISYSF